jgi:radical SAM superfamily enzyme YgiQ (UPF0313 family)
MGRSVASLERDPAVEGDAPPTVVGLVQINNSFSGQSYLPYSVGLLESYARRHLQTSSAYKFLLPVFSRIKVAAAVEHLARADIVGFSLYVWNVRLSLEIARRLKEINPDVIIVVGGPQTPDRPQDFLRENRFIDIACHGEGEQTFVEILKRARTRDWSNIEGTSHINDAGEIVTQPRLKRLRELDQVPSPFTEGIFDPLMAANPQQVWIGLWETNRGCPFGCTFCDWGSATQTKVFQFGIDRLMAEIDWFSNRRIEFLFCCDANFGILQRDVEIARSVADKKLKHGYPKAFSVQNTKNATERAYLTQKILSDAGLNKGVALSLQSVDETTLKNIKRQNISLQTYEELQARFTRDRVETYSDLILGLPGETYESFVDGVCRVISNGQHNRIQFNNLSILPNAEMGEPGYLQRHGMETVEIKIVNIHGAIDEDEVPEMQQLVIATNTLPREDWRRARSFAWMAALVHFDKLAQIPIIVAHEFLGLSYRTIIEAFMQVEPSRFPLLGEIRDFFERSASEIQAGGSEYIYSPSWLGIYWPADEFVFIKLTAEGRLSEFHEECGRLIRSLAPSGKAESKALDDALRLNHALVKQPGHRDDVSVVCGFDLLAFYRGVLNGERIELKEEPVTYGIKRSAEKWTDFQDWCREVVWYGNKKGAYLYGNPAIEVEYAGHY